MLADAFAAEQTPLFLTEFFDPWLKAVSAPGSKVLISRSKAPSIGFQKREATLKELKEKEATVVE